MFSPSFPRRTLGATLITLAAACSDASIPTAPGPRLADVGALSFSEGRGAFQRYVAIGTSVSMGVQSDGAIAASQEQSWPAQLSRMAGREMSLPLIGGTGCRSPLVAPLASGVRISGEGAATPPASLSCAPNVDGVTLPTQNLAINGASTLTALTVTPENVTDAGNAGVTARVLPSGYTQISALEAANPKIVSVEFGANEVLGSRSGIAIPGVTLFPVSAWAPLYTQLVDRAAAVTKHGVLVGLIHDAATFPGFRTGAELYAERATFAAAFNVAVSADCDGSPNLLFVPVRVPTAVATGVAMRRAGAGPYTLSCTGAPANLTDYLLTPAEVAIVNDQLAQMNAYIRAEAERVGFAHFELEELYGRSDIKPPYSVLAQMTSAQPYGQYTSLDGIHPNGEGQRVIAEAAARALDARYNFGILSAALIAVR
jgi:lysophospholipase L1-like esterase